MKEKRGLYICMFSASVHCMKPSLSESLASLKELDSSLLHNSLVKVFHYLTIVWQFLTVYLFR